MTIGRVKWFNPDMGYGFLEPVTGGKDVFVHIRALQAAGITGLVEGQKVGFDVVSNGGKSQAANLKAL